MPQKSVFTFSGHQWDKEERTATFFYKLKHNGEVFDFTETLGFPKEHQLSDLPQELLKSALDNLLLVLGVSYYKLFCPKEIIIEGFSLTREQAIFWNTVYTKGLGELFYKNNIDFRNLISFPFSDSATVKSISIPKTNRSLVGIGGGKDSIVSAELLKTHKKSFTGFVINNHPIREEVISEIGVDSLVVSRKIDPLLFDLNKRVDIYNGHIPVSSQYAFIGLFSALLYDYAYVVVSNEHSANYGNVFYLGVMVNHQWSKSFEFEKMFQAYVKQYITPDVIYFSLLRQLTEIAIVKQFVSYPNYFSHFSSCNRNFKITGQGSDKLWCGECAKCVFAFVLLAAFLSKEDLIKIFAENLFEKESLLQTYKELLGVAVIKPFDCVGTPEEVAVAFSLVSQKGEYDKDVIMKYFKSEILAKSDSIDTLTEQVFQKVSEQSIPKEFEGVV